MKWYHKIIYKVANALIPDAVKRSMAATGRLTTPTNANPWNFFNWLPKKYQTAHNIDMTKLQSYTAEELLEMLISTHPDVSHAIHTYLRMGDTPLTFKAITSTGDDDVKGQKTLDQLLDMLNKPLDSPGYQHGRSLEKLDNMQRLMAMVRGAVAGEVVLSEDCKEVIDIVPVDPSTIWFKREPNNRLVPYQYVKFPKYQEGETWFGQYKMIDSPTFFYEEFDPMVDDPYGRTPILPVLQVVFFHIQVLQDLKAVIHNQGYPRMTVKVLEEVMLKNMPAQYKTDPNAQRKWLGDRLADIQNQFASLNPDDALIGWDSVNYEYLKGSGTSTMVDVGTLINVIDTQLATSLKTLLTLLSRHQGSTETYSSVDVQLYIKTVESARNITRRFWERALSFACRVNGVQTNIKAEYESIDLRTENELESDRQSRLENLESAESNFYITSEEAAELARKTIGIDPKIPNELKQKLKDKHNKPLTPVQENIPMPPAQANKKIKLDATSDDDSDESDHEQQFIDLYLFISSRIQQNLKHATSLESIVPSMSMSSGMQDHQANGLWQLYRGSYVSAYNERANVVGTTPIKNPPTQVSVDLRNQASDVIEGTTNTYHDLVQSAFEEALKETSDLSDDERLTAVKQIMSNWIDENSDYKSQQIAVHEGLKVAALGMFAHDEVFAPQTMYEVLPNSSNHGECLAIIGGSPYTLSQAKALTLPLHPNCPHHISPL